MSADVVRAAWKGRRVSVESKAHRLLAEGRVRVVEVGCGRPGRARVRGDHATYDVAVDADRIVCSCPAWRRTCSHALAVGLIVESSA